MWVSVSNIRFDDLSRHKIIGFLPVGPRWRGGEPLRCKKPGARLGRDDPSSLRNARTCRRHRNGDYRSWARSPKKLPKSRTVRFSLLCLSPNRLDSHSVSFSLLCTAGLGEFRIRDLNDEINKLLREKRHWEDQIRELGGPDYFRVGPRMLDHEGREVPGNRGYRYFGAAKDLPGDMPLLDFLRNYVQNSIETLRFHRRSRIIRSGAPDASQKNAHGTHAGDRRRLLRIQRRWRRAVAAARNRSRKKR